MKKILIIGGSGFIGSSLSRRLHQVNNINFTIMDLVQSKIFPFKTKIIDIRNTIPYKKFKDYDVLVNLAAEHKDNVHPKERYFQTNVIGAKNVCMLASKNNIKKIIFTSSVAVYGLTDLIAGESHKFSPMSQYGKSKCDAEKIYKKWYNEDKKKRSLIIIRPTVVFGEGNRGNIYNLMNLIFSRKFVMIGNGLNKKSIAYVENLSEFIYHSITSYFGFRIYNYVDKPDFNMNNFIKFISKELKINNKINYRIPKSFALIIAYALDFFSIILNKEFKISTIRVRKFCANSIYSSSIDSQDFKPPYSISEGIRRTLKYEFK